MTLIGTHLPLRHFRQVDSDKKKLTVPVPRQKVTTAGYTCLRRKQRGNIPRNITGNTNKVFKTFPTPYILSIINKFTVRTIPLRGVHSFEKNEGVVRMRAKKFVSRSTRFMYVHRVMYAF